MDEVETLEFSVILANLSDESRKKLKIEIWNIYRDQCLSDGNAKVKTDVINSLELALEENGTLTHNELCSLICLIPREQLTESIEIVKGFVGQNIQEAVEI